MSEPVPNWCGCDPSNGFGAEAWFVRKRWERGDCPCCGSAQPGTWLAIAEGVQVCSRCSVPGHLRDTGGWAPLLRALTALHPAWDFMAAMRNLETSPGVSASDLPRLSRGLLALAQEDCS